MTNASVIKKTVEHVKKTLEGEGSGHDWWHIYRVWKMANYIASQEKGADPFIVELGALLHDIADYKLHSGDYTIGPKVARNWLESLKVKEEVINQVCDIIHHLSFKGAKVKETMSSLEGKIVQDADRLDALGAIGITRTFAYGGNKNREIYTPNKKPTLHTSFEAYKKDEGPTINHFYEKLLLLKDRMNTRTGKKLAASRHKYMEQFLARFYKEWDGMA